MDGKDEKPKWATLSQTMFKKSGRIYALGFVDLPVDSRLSAAMKISDNNARYEVSREVQDDMAFIFQNVQEDIADSGQLTRFYGTEVSKNLLSGVKTEKRYWEKMQTFDENGDKSFRLRVYSLVSIKEGDLKKAIKRALDKGKGISPEIKKKIDDHMAREIQRLGEG